MKTPSFRILFPLGIALFSIGCQTAQVDRSPSEAPSRLNFKNITARAGLPATFKSNQTVVADLNDDGYNDLILTQWHIDPIHTQIYLNQRGQGFKPIQISGFAARGSAVLKMARGLFSPGTWGVVVRYPNAPLETYNVRVSERIVTFERVNRLPQVVSNWGDIQIFDHDQDGKLDILATSYYKGANTYAAGPLYLFRQKSNGNFEDYSNRVGLSGLDRLNERSREATIPTYMANVCDIDNDGYLDLLISGYGRRWNKLMFNRGGKYVNQAYELKFDADDNGRDDFRGNGNSFTATCGDIDRDGKLDVFQGEITHQWAGPTSDISSLLYNRYPQPFVRFTNFPRPTRFDNQGDLGSAMGDLDLDGVLDLVIANSDYPPETTMLIFSIEANGTMSNDSKALGETVTNPKGAVLFDYDRDGDLDLVTGENAMRGHDPRTRIFENQAQQTSKTNFLSLVLHGDGQWISSSPVGARVNLSGTPLVRELVFGGGQDAQSPLEAHFGLGEYPNASRMEVEIRWNARLKEKLTLDVNRTYKIVYQPNGSVVTPIR